MADQGGQHFALLQVTSAEEVLRISERSAKEGRRPGAPDYECFFAADPEGFFLGQLGENTISCISIVKYSSEYAFVGQYVVDEPYRGRGYGLQTWRAAMASVPEGCNIGLDAMVDKESVYERSGFKRAWFEQRYDFMASQCASAFSHIQPPPNVKIQPTSRVQFHNLLAYDSAVHVVARPSFLEKWISVQNSQAFAATNDKGEVVGYAAVRKTLREEDGWRIGPLFADNAQIARSLYRSMFESVASEDPTGTIAVDVPYGEQFDPEGLQIAAEELSGKPAFTRVRMYTKGVPPNMPLKKIFGLTTMELG